MKKQLLFKQAIILFVFLLSGYTASSAVYRDLIHKVSYDSNEVASMAAFLSTSTNAATVGFTDPTNPMSCPGVTWTDTTGTAANPAIVARIKTIRWTTSRFTNLFGVFVADHFDSLQTISITYSKKMTAISLTNCSKLINADVSNNVLVTHFVIANAPALVSLNCASGSIDSISLVNFLKLKTLDVSRNTPLTYLNLNNLPLLTALDCSRGKIKKINIVNLPALTSLTCNNNNIDTLKLSSLSTLTFLECSYNKIKVLNVAAAPQLVTLSCSKNPLDTINISSNRLLQDFTFVGAGRTTVPGDTTISLKALILGANDSLKTIDCSINSLTTLNLAGAPKLTSLSLMTNKFASINITANTKLTFLDMTDNLLTTLNVANNTVLAKLFITKNKFTTLSMVNHPSITWISADGNSKLTSLDLTNCKMLNKLYTTGDSTLATLTLAGDTSLQYLYLGSCALTQLPTAEFKNLNTMNCSFNKITSLDFTHNPKLGDINVGNNLLTSLSLYRNDSLVVGTTVQMNLPNNKLTTIDLTGYKKIYNLDCQNNEFTSLKFNPLARKRGSTKIQNNRLRISDLDSMTIKNQSSTSTPAVYTPQKEMILAELDANYSLRLDSIIDLSAEVNSRISDTSKTTFIWRKIDHVTGVTTIINPTVIAPGKFKMDSVLFNSKDTAYVTLINKDYSKFDSINPLKSVKFIMNGLTAINHPTNNDITELKLYPNPTQNVLNISVNGAYTWVVYNILGAPVKQGEGNNFETINMNIVPGTYYIKIQDKKGRIANRKIVVAE